MCVLRHLLLTLFLLTAALPLAGAECKTLVTLVPNVAERCKGGLPGEPVALPEVKKVAQMQAFFLHLFFRDAAVKDGRIRIGVRILLKDAEGTIRFDSRDSIRVLEMKAPAPGKQLLHPSGCRVVLGRDRAPGEYTVEVEVTDYFAQNRVAGDTDKITLTAEPQNGRDFQSPAEVTKFMQGYYLNPEPDRIIPALRFWAKLLPDLRKRGKVADTQIYAWFYFALKQNAQLWKSFAAELSGMEEPDRKGAALVLLALSGKNPKAKAIFEVDGVRDPWQIRVLWHEFFAVGSGRAVEKVCQQIYRVAKGMRPEDFAALPAPAPADRERVKDNLTGRAALWSVHALARKHKLAAGYLNRLLVEKKIQDSFTTEAVLRIIRPGAAEQDLRTVLPAGTEE